MCLPLAESMLGLDPAVGRMDLLLSSHYHSRSLNFDEAVGDKAVGHGNVLAALWRRQLLDSYVRQGSCHES